MVGEVGVEDGDGGFYGGRRDGGCDVSILNCANELILTQGALNIFEMEKQQRRRVSRDWVPCTRRFVRGRGLYLKSKQIIDMALFLTMEDCSYEVAFLLLLLFFLGK